MLTGKTRRLSSAIESMTSRMDSPTAKPAPTHEAPRSALFLIGTPAQCIEELNRRANEWGVGQFIFVGGALETTRRLANEVLRHVGG